MLWEFRPAISVSSHTVFHWGEEILGIFQKSLSKPFQNWLLELYLPYLHLFTWVAVLGKKQQMNGFESQKHTHIYMYLIYINIIKQNLTNEFIIYIYIYITGSLAWSVECSPMVRETWVQSQVASYQKFLKWYLIPPYLTLSNIRYVSRVNWSNPGKGVYLGVVVIEKGALDYGWHIYIYIGCVCGVVVVIIGNGHSDLSSNPEDLTTKFNYNNKNLFREE